MKALALSALQHYAYCPRQFALIHLEQAWSDNHFTAQGNVLHERVDSQEARQWYVNEAATQNWSTRALERQIGSLYYDRLLLSQDKAAVTTEALANMATLEQSPRAFVRDPVMLEFLGLPNAAASNNSASRRAVGESGKSAARNKLAMIVIYSPIAAN